MKLVTFLDNNLHKIGRVEDEEIIDLSNTNLPKDMGSLISSPECLAVAKNASGVSHTLSDAHLCSPVRNPNKILAIGLNYKDHIEETGLATPEFPMFFNKQTTAVNGPYDEIHLPKVSDKLDYEGELGFVIGKNCRHVPKEEAHKVIAGFVVCNDVSVRDWQMKAQTFTLGKSFDTHSPFGPWLTTSDEIEDPHNLGIKTWVNGELRQDSNTKHLVFDCYDQIATLTAAFTLETGDLILTGTPSGVGIGFSPKKFLCAGDRVRIEIEELGYIENTVIQEPTSTKLI
jgi:2-keto-4-pentenoate hydratase/2-oxohepta-3-ene-1,7-dioic acid hydratase in catechol pathway